MIAHIICLLLGHRWHLASFHRLSRRSELLASTAECSRCGARKHDYTTLSAMELTVH